MSSVAAATAPSVDGLVQPMSKASIKPQPPTWATVPVVRVRRDVLSRIVEFDGRGEVRKSCVKLLRVLRR